MSILHVSNPSVSSPSFKTVWQHNVAQSDLPFPVKGLLLIVATEWMGADGGSCFPTEQQIMERAGVSRPTVTKHLKIAVDGGYIERWRWGHGNKNRRYNYQATLPGQTASEIEMGNDVSYPTGEMGNIFSDHEPVPSFNQNQEGAAAQPAPASPPSPEPQPAPPAQAPLSKPRPIKTAVPDSIPTVWLEQAAVQRPDLTAEDIAKSAGVFVDHHRAKGSMMVDWSAAFRVWIARERAPRATAPRPQQAQPERRYQTPAQEAALQEANKRAMEASEARRIAMLVRNGIDPMTGLKLVPATPARKPAVTPPPSPPSRDGMSYAERFARLQAIEAARKLARESGQTPDSGSSI